MIQNNKSELYPWGKKEDNLNCASYALNCDYWYTPSDNEDIFYGEYAEELYYENFSHEEIVSILWEKSVNNILNDFYTNIRLITNECELTIDEELVAFRVGLILDEETNYVEYDFHFRVKRNGVWKEKCGIMDVQECVEDIKKSVWINGTMKYTGPIAFFAHKIVK